MLKDSLNTYQYTILKKLLPLLLCVVLSLGFEFTAARDNLQMTYGIVSQKILNSYLKVSKVHWLQ